MIDENTSILIKKSAFGGINLYVILVELKENYIATLIGDYQYFLS